MEEKAVGKKKRYGMYDSGNNLGSTQGSNIRIIGEKTGTDLVADRTFVMGGVVRMKMNCGLVESQKNQTDDKYPDPFPVGEIERSLPFHHF